MTESKPPESTVPDNDLEKKNEGIEHQPYEIQVPTSRRLSLTNVRRQLTDEELANPGVQKLLLDILEEAETERDNNKVYITSYFEADKKAAILGEKLLADKKIDVFFGVGVGLGGAILGLAPYFSQVNGLYGYICLAIGLVLMIGASIGRALKK